MFGLLLAFSYFGLSQPMKPSALNTNMIETSKNTKVDIKYNEIKIALTSCEGVTAVKCLLWYEIPTYDFKDIGEDANLAIDIGSLTLIPDAFDFMKLPESVKNITIFGSSEYDLGIHNYFEIDIGKIPNHVKILELSYSNIIFSDSSDSKEIELDKVKINHIYIDQDYSEKINVIISSPNSIITDESTESKTIKKYILPITSMKIIKDTEADNLTDYGKIYLKVSDVPTYSFDDIYKSITQLTIEVSSDCQYALNFNPLNETISEIIVNCVSKNIIGFDPALLGYKGKTVTYNSAMIRFLSSQGVSRFQIQSLNFNSCGMDPMSDDVYIKFQGFGLTCIESEDVRLYLTPCKSILVQKICDQVVEGIQCLTDRQVKRYDFSSLDVTTKYLYIDIRTDITDSFNFGSVPSYISSITIKADELKAIGFDIGLFDKIEFDMIMQKLKINFSTTKNTYFTLPSLKFTNCELDENSIFHSEYIGNNLICERSADISYYLTPIRKVILENKCDVKVDGQLCITSFSSSLSSITRYFTNLKVEINIDSPYNGIVLDNINSNILTVDFISSKNCTLAIYVDRYGTNIQNISYSGLVTFFQYYSTREETFFCNALTFINCTLDERNTSPIKYIGFSINGVNSGSVINFLKPSSLAKKLMIKGNCNDYTEEVQCLTSQMIQFYDYSTIEQTEIIEIDVSVNISRTYAFDFSKVPSTFRSINIKDPNSRTSSQLSVAFIVTSLGSIRKLNFEYLEIQFVSPVTNKEFALEFIGFTHCSYSSSSNKCEYVGSEYLFNNSPTIGEKIMKQTYIIIKDDCSLDRDVNDYKYGFQCLTPSEMNSFKFSNVKITLDPYQIIVDTSQITSSFLYLYYFPSSATKVIIKSNKDALTNKFNFVLMNNDYGENFKLDLINLKVQFFITSDCTSKTTALYLNELTITDCELEASSCLTEFIGNRLVCTNSPGFEHFLTSNTKIVVREECSEKVLGEDCITPSEMRSYDFSKISQKIGTLNIIIEVQTDSYFEFYAHNRILSKILTLNISSANKDPTTSSIGFSSDQVSSYFKTISFNGLNILFSSVSDREISTETLIFINCNYSSDIKVDFFGTNLECDEISKNNKIDCFLTPIKTILIGKEATCPNTNGIRCVELGKEREYDFKDIPTRSSKIFIEFDNLMGEIAESLDINKITSSNLKYLTYQGELNTFRFYVDDLKSYFYINFIGLDIIFSHQSTSGTISARVYLDFKNCTLNSDSAIDIIINQFDYISCDDISFENGIKKYLAPFNNLNIKSTCDASSNFNSICITPEEVNNFNFSSIIGKLNGRSSFYIYLYTDCKEYFKLSQLNNEINTLYVRKSGYEYLMAFDLSENIDFDISFSYLTMIFKSSNERQISQIKYLSFSSCYLSKELSDGRPDYAIIGSISSSYDSVINYLSPKNELYYTTGSCYENNNRIYFNNLSRIGYYLDRITKNPETTEITVYITTATFVEPFPFESVPKNINSITIDGNYYNNKLIFDFSKVGETITYIKTISCKMEFKCSDYYGQLYTGSLYFESCTTIDNHPDVPRFSGSLTIYSSSDVKKVLTPYESINVKNSCSSSDPSYNPLCITPSKVADYNFQDINIKRSSLTIYVNTDLANSFDFSKLRDITTVVIDSSGSSSKKNFSFDATKLGNIKDLTLKSSMIKFEATPLKYFYLDSLTIQNCNLDLNSSPNKFNGLKLLNTNSDDVYNFLTSDVSEKNNIVIEEVCSEYRESYQCITPDSIESFDFDSLTIIDNKTIIEVNVNTSKHFDFSRIENSVSVELVTQEGQQSTIGLYFTRSNQGPKEIILKNLNVAFSSDAYEVSTITEVKFQNCELSEETSNKFLITSQVSFENSDSIAAFLKPYDSVIINQKCEGNYFLDNNCVNYDDITSMTFALYNQNSLTIIMNYSTTVSFPLNDYDGKKVIFQKSNDINYKPDVYIDRDKLNQIEELTINNLTLRFINNNYYYSFKTIMHTLTINNCDAGYSSSIKFAGDSLTIINSYSIEQLLKPSKVNKIIISNVGCSEIDNEVNYGSVSNDMVCYRNSKFDNFDFSQISNTDTITIESTEDLSIPFNFSKATSSLKKLNLNFNNKKKAILDLGTLNKIDSIAVQSCDLILTDSSNPQYKYYLFKELELRNTNVALNTHVISNIVYLGEIGGPGFGVVGGYTGYNLKGNIITTIEVNTNCAPPIGLSNKKCISPSELADYNFDCVEKDGDITIEVKTNSNSAFDFNKLQYDIQSIKYHSEVNENNKIVLDTSLLGRIKSFIFDRVEVRFISTNNEIRFGSNIEEFNFTNCKLGTDNAPHQKYFGKNPFYLNSQLLEDYLTPIDKIIVQCPAILLTGEDCVSSIEDIETYDFQLYDDSDKILNIRMDMSMNYDIDFNNFSSKFEEVYIFSITPDLRYKFYISTIEKYKSIKHVTIDSFDLVFVIEENQHTFELQSTVSIKNCKIVSSTANVLKYVSDPNKLEVVSSDDINYYLRPVSSIEIKESCNSKIAGTICLNPASIASINYFETLSNNNELAIIYCYNFQFNVNPVINFSKFPSNIQRILIKSETTSVRNVVFDASTVSNNIRDINFKYVNIKFTGAVQVFSTSNSLSFTKCTKDLGSNDVLEYVGTINSDEDSKEIENYLTGIHQIDIRPNCDSSKTAVAGVKCLTPSEIDNFAFSTISQNRKKLTIVLYTNLTKAIKFDRITPQQRIDKIIVRSSESTKMNFVFDTAFNLEMSLEFQYLNIKFISTAKTFGNKFNELSIYYCTYNTSPETLKYVGKQLTVDSDSDIGKYLTPFYKLYISYSTSSEAGQYYVQPSSINRIDYSLFDHNIEELVVNVDTYTIDYALQFQNLPSKIKKITIIGETTFRYEYLFDIGYISENIEEISFSYVTVFFTSKSKNTKFYLDKIRFNSCSLGDSQEYGHLTYTGPNLQHDSESKPIAVFIAPIKAIGIISSSSQCQVGELCMYSAEMLEYDYIDFYDKSSVDIYLHTGFYNFNFSKHVPRHIKEVNIRCTETLSQVFEFDVATIGHITSLSFNSIKMNFIDSSYKLAFDIDSISFYSCTLYTYSMKYLQFTGSSNKIYYYNSGNIRLYLTPKTIVQVKESCSTDYIDDETFCFRSSSLDRYSLIGMSRLTDTIQIFVKTSVSKANNLNTLPENIKNVEITNGNIETVAYYTIGYDIDLSSNIQNIIFKSLSINFIVNEKVFDTDNITFIDCRKDTINNYRLKYRGSGLTCINSDTILKYLTPVNTINIKYTCIGEDDLNEQCLVSDEVYYTNLEQFIDWDIDSLTFKLFIDITAYSINFDSLSEKIKNVIIRSNDDTKKIIRFDVTLINTSALDSLSFNSLNILFAASEDEHVLRVHTLNIENCDLYPDNYPKIDFIGTTLNTDNTFQNYLLPWEKVEIKELCEPKANILCTYNELNKYLPYLSEEITTLRIDLSCSYANSVNWNRMPRNIERLEAVGKDPSIKRALPFSVTTLPTSLKSIMLQNIEIIFQNDQVSTSIKDIDISFDGCGISPLAQPILKYRGNKAQYTNSNEVERYLTPIKKLRITSGTNGYEDGTHIFSLDSFESFDFGQVDWNIEKLSITVDESVNQPFNFNLLPENVKEIEFNGQDNSKSIYFIPELIPNRIKFMKFKDLTINFKSNVNMIFFFIDSIEFYNCKYGTDCTEMFYKGTSSKFENSQSVYEKIIPQNYAQIYVRDQCTEITEGVLCLVPDEISLLKFDKISADTAGVDIIYYTDAPQAFKLVDLRDNLVSFHFRSGNTNKYSIGFDAGYLQKSVTTLTFKDLSINFLATGINHTRIDSIQFYDCLLAGNQADLKYSGPLQNFVCENSLDVCNSLMPKYDTIEVRRDCEVYYENVQCLLESEILEYEFITNNKGHSLTIELQFSTRNSFNLTLIPKSVTYLSIIGENINTTYVLDVNEIDSNIRLLMLENIDLVLQDSQNREVFEIDQLVLKNCNLLEKTNERLEFIGNLIHYDSLEIAMFIKPIEYIDVKAECSRTPGHVCLMESEVKDYNFDKVTHVSNKLTVNIYAPVITSFDFSRCPQNILSIDILSDETEYFDNSIGYDVHKTGNIQSIKFSFLRIIFFSDTESFNISSIEFSYCKLNKPNLVSHLEYLGETLVCTNSIEIENFLRPIAAIRVSTACLLEPEVHCIAPNDVAMYDFNEITRFRSDTLAISIEYEMEQSFDFTKLRDNINKVIIVGSLKEKFILDVDKLGTINDYSFGLITILFVSKLEKARITLESFKFFRCDLDREDNIKELIYEGDGLVCVKSDDVLIRLVPIRTIEVQHACVDPVKTIHCISTDEVADYSFKYVSLDIDTLTIDINYDCIDSFNFNILPQNIKNVVINSKSPNAPIFMFDVDHSNEELSFSISNLDIEFTAMRQIVHFKYQNFTLTGCTGDTILKILKYEGDDFECDNDKLKALLTPVTQVVVHDDENCGAYDAQQGINGVACISYDKVETFDFNCLPYRDDLTTLPVIVRNPNLVGTTYLNVFNFSTLPSSFTSITFSNNPGDKAVGSIRFNHQNLPSRINRIEFTNLEVTFNSDVNFFMLDDSLSFTNCKLGPESDTVKYTWINLKCTNSNDVKTHLTPTPSGSIQIKDACDEFVDKVQCIPSKFVSIYDFSTMNPSTKATTVQIINNVDGRLDLTKSSLNSIVYKSMNLDDLTFGFDTSLIGKVDDIKFEGLSIIFSNSKEITKFNISHLEFVNCSINSGSQTNIAKFYGPDKNIICKDSKEIFDLFDTVLYKLHIIKSCDKFDDSQIDSACIDVNNSNMFDLDKYDGARFELIVHDDIPRDHAINLSTVKLASDVTIRGFNSSEKLREETKKVSAFLKVDEIVNTKSLVFDNIIIKLSSDDTSGDIEIPVKNITFTPTAELDTTESNENIKIPDDGTINGNEAAEQFLSRVTAKPGLSQGALIGIIVAVVVVVVVIIVVAVVIVCKKSDCHCSCGGGGKNSYSDDYGAPASVASSTKDFYVPPPSSFRSEKPKKVKQEKPKKEKKSKKSKKKRDYSDDSFEDISL